MTKKQEPIFENEICVRCKGTGTGIKSTTTKCISCDGVGYRLTKRGAAACHYYLNSLYVRADALKAGQKIRCECDSDGAFWLAVDCVEQSKEGAIIAQGVRKTKGRRYKFAFDPEEEIRIAHTAQAKDEKLAKALVYEKTLTKNGGDRAAVAHQTQGATVAAQRQGARLGLSVLL